MSSERETVFYRIVKTDPPTPLDFTSNKALGKAPRGPERDDPALWEGLSMYNSEAAARQQARRIPKLGAYLARLSVAGVETVRYGQTLSNPAHHTVWGEPNVLIGCITDVIAVDAEAGRESQ
jgi:hypothetical protein